MDVSACLIQTCLSFQLWDDLSLNGNAETLISKISFIEFPHQITINWDVFRSVLIYFEMHLENITMKECVIGFGDGPAVCFASSEPSALRGRRKLSWNEWCRPKLL